MSLVGAVRNVITFNAAMTRWEQQRSFQKFVTKELKPFSDHSSFLQWRDTALVAFPETAYKQDDSRLFHQLQAKLESENPDSRLPFGGGMISVEEKTGWRRFERKRLLLLNTRDYLDFLQYPAAVDFQVRSGYGLLIAEKVFKKGEKVFNKRTVDLLSNHNSPDWRTGEPVWHLDPETSHAIIGLTPLIIEDRSKSLMYESAIEITLDNSRA
jgi:hypothetical protein